MFHKFNARSLASRITKEIKDMVPSLGGWSFTKKTNKTTTHNKLHGTSEKSEFGFSNRPFSKSIGSFLTRSVPK